MTFKDPEGEPQRGQREGKTVSGLTSDRAICSCAEVEGRAVSDGHMNLDRHDLAREYEKFFQAVEASPSCVVITDKKGVIEYVNDRFVASTGYTREQAIGRKPSLLKSGHTPQHMYRSLWETISAGNIWRGEMCNRKRSGEHYWESTAIAPIVGSGGEITHYVAVKEDITERRHAQSELQRRQERDASLAAITRVLLADASAAAVEKALQILCASLSAERGYLFRTSNDETTITNTHEWVADKMVSQRKNFVDVACEHFKWCLDQHHTGQAVAVNDTADLPNDAGKFRTTLLSGGVQANLSAPIHLGKKFIGFVGVDVHAAPRTWDAGDISHLEQVAEIIGLALLRMEAEDELRATRDRAARAEQNLVDAIESMPEGFVLYDARGKLEICNSRFRDDYGYSEEQARPGVHFKTLGLLDVKQGNVSLPEGFADIEAYLETKLEYRLKLEDTFPVQLKDGRHLMTRDRRTTSGGLVSVQTDITKIKQTEEALRSSERKFWGVFHSSPSMMTISDTKDGRFIDVNAKWVEVMGFDYGDAVGKTASELEIWSSPVVRDKMLSQFDKDGVLTDFESRIKTRGGKMRDLLVSGVRMQVEGEEAVLLVNHDITDRKAMEQALKHSDQEVRTILDNIVEAFYRTGDDEVITMCSAAVENLLGYTPEELIGVSAHSLYADGGEHAAFLQAVQDGGGKTRDFEVRLKHKDGSEIWAASSGHFIYDRDDNVVGLEGTTRDITRRKNAEHALLLAKEQAEQASAAKSDFLSGMSHELRTPLNAVIGFSQMMEFQGDNPLSDRQREYLDIVRRSGEHLLALINEVLDLARVESGRMDLHIAPVGPDDLIEECTALVRAMAAQKSITITVETCRQELPHIAVDRMKFKQILINLLSNAVKYNVEGGSVVVVAKPDAQSNLRIDVTDTGHGLDPEECAALFEPFQRLGAERTGVEGTGLGLAMAKRMIEAMGGVIQVASMPGTGSTFTIIVPLAVG